MLAAPKALMITGGATTVIEAVAVLPVPPSVDVTWTLLVFGASLVTIVTHELRTPLAVVRASLELIGTAAREAGAPGTATLETDPGPELADKQVAENELMPFPVLDACLHLYAGEKMSPDEIGAALKALFPNYPADKLANWAKRFTKLFSQSIYKWVQSPLSLHVGSLDLDRERALQMPVVQKNEWQ